MKKIKKLVAVMLAAIMVLCMGGMSVWADTPESTQTVTDANGYTVTTDTYSDGKVVVTTTKYDDSATPQLTYKVVVTTETNTVSYTTTVTTTTETWTDFTNTAYVGTKTVEVVATTTDGTNVTKIETTTTTTTYADSTDTTGMITDKSEKTVENSYTSSTLTEITTTTVIYSGDTKTSSIAVEETYDATTGLLTKKVTTTITYNADGTTVSTTEVETETYVYNSSTNALEQTTTVTNTYNGDATGTPASMKTEISGAKGSSEATYDLTINNEVEGYVYTAYQVFSGDLYDVYTQSTNPSTETELYTYDETTKTFSKATYDSTAASKGTVYYTKSSTLSNIIWGSDMDTSSQIGDNNYTLLDAIKAIETSTGGKPFENVASAADVAAILTNCGSDSEVLQLFAETVAPYITGSGTASTANNVSDEFAGSYTISGLAPGYYLVASTTVPTGASESRYILQVVSNSEVDTKSDVPTVKKTVDDEDGYVTIGQTVTYTLTATLPSTYADYSIYKLIFHDTLSAGLTFDDTSVKVIVRVYALNADGSKNENSYTDYLVTNGSTTYYTLKTVSTDTTTFELGITNTKTLYGGEITYAADGSIDTVDTAIDLSSTITAANTDIIVTYNATVNESAVTGSAGNTNSVSLEYSNNPNSGGEGETGTTTTETVVLFTFELDVTKTDDDSTYPTSLEGAEFVMYVYLDSNGDITSDGSGTLNYLIIGSDGSISYTTTESNATVFTSDSTGLFEITGILPGTYYLKETKAPDGYNLMTDIVKVVINATKNATSGALETLTATVKVGENGNASAVTGIDLTEGIIPISITNSAGSPIPSTGGMGTTILYIIGAILVIGAAVILVTRRRMANK